MSIGHAVQVEKTGLLQEQVKADKEASERGNQATNTLNNFTGTLTRSEEIAKPDTIYGDAPIDDLLIGDETKVETVDTSKSVKSDNLIDLITEAQKGPALPKEERDKQRAMAEAEAKKKAETAKKKKTTSTAKKKTQAKITSPKE